MEKIICGVLKKYKKFYFYFDQEKNILTIQPSKMKKNISIICDWNFDDFPYLKEYISLEGETNLHTFIGFYNLKFISIGRGCFQAWVPAYIIGKVNGIYPIAKPNKIQKIYFKGDCIDRFMSSKLSIKNIHDKNTKNLTINFDYNKDKSKIFLHNGFKYSLTPGYSMPSILKDPNVVLSTRTTLIVESSKKIKIKDILEIYKKVEMLFAFINHRQHVGFNEISISQIEQVEYLEHEVKNTQIEFELNIANSNSEIDLHKMGKNMILENYIDKIPNLINCILDDKFMLLSFPINSLKENVIDNNRYLNISSTFESEFDIMNPNFKSERKKNYKKAKLTTLDFLEKEMKNSEFNSETRKYFKDIYEFIDNLEGRLEEQIKYSLDKFSYIVEPERKWYTSKYKNINFCNENIAKEFALKRNSLSHGFEIKKFNEIEIASFVIISKLNYSMLLYRAGFNEKEIIDIVNKIF